MRVPRTRGAFSGLVLVLLGAWGAVIAFIGPYFHYAYTPDDTWTYNSDRLWMEILPGAAVMLAGLIVLGSANRALASFAAWLAVLGGAWFVVGQPLSALSGMPDPGAPTGGNTRQVLETLGFFYGLGIVIVFFAALAMGRFAVVGIRETRAAERDEAEERLATIDSAALAAGTPAAVADTRAPVAEEPQSSAGWTAPPSMADARAEDARATDAADRSAVAGMPTSGTTTPGALPADHGPVDRAPADEGIDWNPPTGAHAAEPHAGTHASPDPYGGWTAPAADGQLPAAPPVQEPAASEEDGESRMHRLLHRHEHSS